MHSFFARFLLWLSAYIPLALIFTLLYWQQQIVIGIIALVLAGGGLLGVGLLFMVTHRRVTPLRLRIITYQKRDSEVMSYIITYIVPFLAVPFSDWRQAVALCIFLALVGFLYISSNMIYINPILNLMGYHLYEVTLERREEKIYHLIARSPVEKDAQLTLLRVSDDIMLEKMPWRAAKRSSR